MAVGGLLDGNLFPTVSRGICSVQCLIVTLTTRSKVIACFDVGCFDV